MTDPIAAALRQNRPAWSETIPWILGVAAYFAFADRLPFASQIVIMILFALSLDLVLGYAGIVTLGHAAFYGTGAYAAGIYAIHVSHEPLSGLAVAALSAAIVGLVSGLVILRTHGLTQLMLTLAFATLLAEAANKASFVTGGNDGLQGIEIDPIAGLFRFDMFGRAGYLYCLIVLFCCWLLLRVLLASAFGQSLIGIRENVTRMHAIGAPVTKRLLIAYAIGAAMAGVAGGLLAQTTQFVGQSVLSFERSGEIVILLVFGGIGRLNGAFIGAAVYMIAQDQLAKSDPEFWNFWIGLILVLTVLFARGGILGVYDRLRRRWSPALETIGLAKQFGAIPVANDIHFRLPRGARHALIGPNGAGKTTFVNLLTGRLRPSSGRVLLNGRDVTHAGQALRARGGLARTFQINNLFPALTVLENVRLAVAEHRGLFTARRALLDEAHEILVRLGLGGDALSMARTLPYGKQRLVEIAIALAAEPAVLLLDEPAAGVPNGESGIILDVIEQLPADMAVLMIEHDMDLVFRFARRITVLVRGTVLVEGTPEEIAADPRVREVYLGSRGHG